MALRHAIDDAYDGQPATSGFSVTFPNGLVGCPHWRRFTLTEDPDVPAVALLQSLDDAAIGFLVTEVTSIVPEFFERLAREDIVAFKSLGAGQDPDVTVYCTLTIHETGAITANLAGPLVLDRRRGFGTQVVLVNPPWSVRHPVGDVAR